MNLFSRLAAMFTGRPGEVRPQNLSYAESVLEAFGVVPGAAGVAVTPVSAMRVAAVFACVQKIAGAIATLPIHAYQTDGDVKVRLPRDDLWFKLNEQPHSQLTAASHWEGVSAAQLLRGDAYTWIRRNQNNTVRELLPLHPGCVSPIRQQDGSVRYYISLPEFGISTWLEPAEVLHFPGFGFDMHTMRSMSVISYAARNAIGNAIAMDEYSGRFFQNGAHPSIVLSTDKVMSDAQKDALRTAFAAKYSGVENAHKLPLVLTEGLKANEISLTAEDSQLLEARQFQVVDIARAFGVPPHMIGETSASTSWGSGIESMSRGFVTYTLQPHLVRIEQELNRKLFSRNPGRFLQFDRDALIEGDSKAQAEYNRAALGGPGTGQGWMTVNEIRKTKGLGPLDGGEKLFDPAQQAAAAAAKVGNDVRELRASVSALADRPTPEPVVVNVAAPASPAPVVNVAAPSAPVVNVAAPHVTVDNHVPAQPAPVVNVDNHLPEQRETVVNVECVMPPPAAPVIHVVNQAGPAEVKVISMPERRTEGTVVRDKKSGDLTGSVLIERDVDNEEG